MDRCDARDDCLDSPGICERCSEIDDELCSAAYRLAVKGVLDDRTQALLRQARFVESHPQRYGLPVLRAAGRTLKAARELRKA